MKSDVYVKRLLSEISKSADSKLTKKLIAAARRFPKKQSIETSVFKMIQNKQIIFPHQEAECLRAVRYLSTLNNDTINHCWNRVMDKSEDRYLRMESAYLLSRTKLTRKQIDKLSNVFRAEPDDYVQAAMACLLVQRLKNNPDVVRELVFHPNEKVRDVGKLFRTVKNETKIAKQALRHSLRKEIPWVTCDYMPLLHLMSISSNREIRRLLLDSIRQPRLDHPIAGVREILKDIFTKTRVSMAASP
jgi:hypothetical protein